MREINFRNFKRKKIQRQKLTFKIYRWLDVREDQRVEIHRVISIMPENVVFLPTRIFCEKKRKNAKKINFELTRNDLTNKNLALPTSFRRFFEPHARLSTLAVEIIMNLFDSENKQKKCEFRKSYFLLLQNFQIVRFWEILNISQPLNFNNFHWKVSLRKSNSDIWINYLILPQDKNQPFDFILDWFYIKMFVNCHGRCRKNTLTWGFCLSNWFI